MDATKDVVLDRVAIRDGIVGNVKSASSEIVIDDGGNETLDFYWEV